MSELAAHQGNNHVLGVGLDIYVCQRMHRSACHWLRVLHWFFWSHHQLHSVCADVQRSPEQRDGFDSSDAAALAADPF